LSIPLFPKKSGAIVGLGWTPDYSEQLVPLLLKGNKMPQSLKHKTIYPGVRFREHPTRKFNGKQDKYFFIRYRYQGRLKEEGLGWASEGWNASKASGVLGKLKESIKLGEGPQTLAEKRRILKEKQEAEQTKKEREKRENITFGQIFSNQYSSDLPPVFVPVFKLELNPIPNCFVSTETAES
jgi:hypothetical protein